MNGTTTTSEALRQPESLEALEPQAVKDQLVVPAIEYLIREGWWDQAVWRRLNDVQEARVQVGNTKENETGQKFAFTEDGELFVPDGRFVPHETMHLLGDFAWSPLNEGVADMFADQVSARIREHNGYETGLDLYPDNKALVVTVQKLAGLYSPRHSEAETSISNVYLSRMYSGADAEANFRELDARIYKNTGKEALLQGVRSHQQNSKFLIQAKEEVGDSIWYEKMSSSERLAAEAKVINQELQSFYEQLKLGRRAIS